MRSRRWRVIVRLLLAVLAPFLGVNIVITLERCTWTTEGGPFERIRHRIARHMADAGVPSFSVAAAKSGRIVWEESFGWADLENRIEATPHTMYALASTSKVLTATGIMVLVEQGRVELDAPISDYLGDVGLRAYEGETLDVTLRRIFTHTSGLPRFWCQYYADELATRPSARELVRRYGALVAPPGERYIYSNLGIALAGMVIEEVSGRSYADFMQSEVLDPLGLTRTAIITAPYDDAGIAQKYEGRRRLPFSDMGIRAAGSAWASAHDLLRFGMFHLKDHLPQQKAILSDATIDAMYRSVDPRLPHHDFHLPWIESRHRGYRILQFGGHVHGGKVSLRLVPSEDIAVVVMSNGEEADTPRVADWVLDRMLPGFSWTGMARHLAARIARLGATRATKRDVATGKWRGEIRGHDASVPVQMVLDDHGVAWLGIPDGPAAKRARAETGPRVSGGVFFARFARPVPLDDTSRAVHRTYLELGLRDDRLSGPVYAESEGFFFCLPFYADLRRQDDAGRHGGLE